MNKTRFLEHFEVVESVSNIGGAPYYLNVYTKRYRILIEEKNNKSVPVVKVMMYED